MTKAIFFHGRAALALALLLGTGVAVAGGEPPPRPYYQAPTWQPRAILPAEDALRGDFWPPSPAQRIDYDDPGFDEARLSQVPAPGVHPRVLMNPADVDRVRAKVALGEGAPPAFRALWQRCARERTAFYALVAGDDQLGRELAAQLSKKIAALDPKIDRMDQRADRDNLWAVERSTIASGDPDPPTEIWSLLDYDYLSGWMSAEEREQARRVIAKLVAHRISNFMMVPDHFMINNHQGFGMEYIRLMLLIEGEPGFDQRVFDLAAKKARAMLDWSLDGEGMSAESIKGWLNTSAFVAVGLRQRDLLRHGHLRAKMRFFQAAARWEDGAWKIRDEMRASAFHVIWMMHYYHPEDRGIDFLYRATLSTHPFLTDAAAKWPNPVGVVPELLLLWADDGLTDPAGKPLDWTDQARIDSLHLPLTWRDDTRGYVETRNTWRKDDLHVGFTTKQDFYYGGHEGSEAGRFTVWRDGVNWVRDVDMLGTKATFLQNMLTVDGRGQHWPPAPGTWLGVRESPEGVVAAGDDKDGYAYTKSMQIHPLAFPSAKLPYYAPFTEGNFDLGRDLQVAFNPRTVKFNDGYAHTDYGPWSGETRLVEDYKQWNPMERAYRTVHVARGEHPYVLVLDDAKKDDQPHQFDWNITVPAGVRLLDAQTPEIVYQNSEPSGSREDDLLLGAADTPQGKDGKYLPKKGQPLCLVRVLWRNTDYGFPVPRLEQFQGYNHLTVPARSVSPEFRVLIYPHRQGDPLPKTAWNRDRTELTVQIGEQRDGYRLGAADGGRTAMAMERHGQTVLTSDAPPARPVLSVRGSRFDANDLRYTRREGNPPEYLVDEKLDVAFVRARAPAQIRYTLDGSDPSEGSTLYEAPFPVARTCELKARVFDPLWQGGPRQSEILAARFTRRAPAAGGAEPPGGTRPGLLARVYELKTVLWNDRGFFDAGKIMLPDVRRETPSLVAATPGFALPHVVPARPQEQQCKGFYRFSGWFQAPERGVYEFAVDSCGPVTLDVGGQTAIENIGVFHQQQAVRRGEAVLGPGWHPVELVVCDPQFWHLNSLAPMPLTVTCRVNGGEAREIPQAGLRFQPEADAGPATPEPAWHDAAQHLPRLEAGAVLNVYDRTGRRREPDFLDVDALEPIRTEAVSEILPNVNRNQAHCYEGYFHAPEPGVYTFDLPAREGESAGLGATQATCQNQLRVDGEVVVQRGVPGRNPTRRVGLQAGWFPLSIRLGPSAVPGSVTYPDGEQVPLTAALLSRPVLVRILPENDPVQRRAYELFAPRKVTLSLPGDPAAEIRYTLDGREPDANATLYTGGLTIAASEEVTASAFQAGRAITAPARAAFHRVDLPEAELLGQVSFEGWNGGAGAFRTGDPFGVWIAADSRPADDPRGEALAAHAGDASAGSQPKTDVNVARPASTAAFKVWGLKMRENSLSVAVWFKGAAGTGKLFGKEGYNAFGKSYKTVSCGLADGRLVAGPGHLAGGKLPSDAWQHVVMTGDERELALYLNGERVATGPGSPDLTTDALDFFTDLPATVAGVRLYNRVLSPDDVRQLFTWERDHAPVQRGP